MTPRSNFKLTQREHNFEQDWCRSFVCTSAAFPMQNRLILSESQAVEIYRIKLDVLITCPEGEWTKSPSTRISGKSVDIGRLFNVSPKTVRDIWNHVTWKYATCHLWANQDESDVRSEHQQASCISIVSPIKTLSPFESELTIK
jgi:hypothetical protein